MTTKQIKLAIGAGVALLVLIIGVAIFSSTYNRVVTLEENINTSQSNISKEEQRRVDLFNNLVDAVQSYDQFEQATLEKVIQARQQANGGQIENAQLTLAAVVEQYPQLKAQENYKQAMTEFSITENRVANYREQYNNDVRSYKTKTRKAGTSIVLGLMGYDKQDFRYLDYNVKGSEHRDLFKR
jgi:LemA protein